MKRTTIRPSSKMMDLRTRHLDSLLNTYQEPYHLCRQHQVGSQAQDQEKAGKQERRSPTRGPFYITRETTPFAEVLAAANAHIPSDLIPGASVDEEFRKNLLKVINVDFKEVLQASQSLIQTAQSMFEYKGMDIWIILQKYILKASQDADSQKNLILMVVLLCERGTNFDKYASKMSKEGASMVNIL